jgi:hypothetical protein
MQRLLCSHGRHRRNTAQYGAIRRNTAQFGAIRANGATRAKGRKRAQLGATRRNSAQFGAFIKIKNITWKTAWNSMLNTYWVSNNNINILYCLTLSDVRSIFRD